MTLLARDRSEDGAWVDGLDLFGGEVYGAQYTDDRDVFISSVARRYARTPALEEGQVPRGQYAHIGDGIFLKRCRSCDTFIKTYGSILYVREFAEHEAAHGLVVPGYNVGLLA